MSAAIALGLTAGCADKGLPPAPTVREEVHLPPLVRARTPDEAFGGPRPKLDPLIGEVLDGRWRRQLQLKSLHFVVTTSRVARSADGSTEQNFDTTNYVWDERWGYRSVGGELRGTNPWGPMVIRDTGKGIKPSLTADPYRMTYAPLAILEFGGPAEFEQLIRAEPDAYSARREQLDGKAVVRLEHRQSDKRSWERWWLDPDRGYLVIEAEATLYPSPETYGQNAVVTSSMAVSRTAELTPGVIVPVEWRSHQHLEGWKESMLPGGKRDSVTAHACTVLEGNPPIDPENFRVIRVRPAKPGETVGKR